MIIGLTGSIGAGKSTVSAKLRELGALVLDADVFARDAVESGSPGLARIAREFGPGILNRDGSLDRAAMAAEVFAVEGKRQKLNAIVHPIVLTRLRAETETCAEAEPQRPVVWDVPLLIESGWAELVNAVWLVSAGKEARVKRIVARDGCTPSQALSRIAAQMPDEEKRRYAHVIFDNNGDIPALLAQVERQYLALVGRAAP